jgi:hypothetical protein
MVRRAVARVARVAAGALNLRSDAPQAEPKKSHQLLVVVKMVNDSTYHVWAKKPQHIPRHRYNGELPDLLKLAFRFAGSRSAYCHTEQPKLKHFQHDKVDWNPRLVDWSLLVDFSVLENVNHEECHIVPEDESPFKGKIKSA